MSTGFKVFIVIIVVIVCLPVVTFGLPSGICFVRAVSLDARMSKMNAKLEKQNTLPTYQKGKVDKSCTSLGTQGNIGFDSNKHYSNVLEAKNDIFNNLNAVGIVAPTVNEEPFLVSETDDESPYVQYSTNKIDLSYRKDGKYTYYVTVELAKPVPINGASNTQPLENFLSNVPVVSTEFHAYIYTF